MPAHGADAELNQDARYFGNNSRSDSRRQTEVCRTICPSHFGYQAPSFSLKNLRSDLTKLWQYRDLLYTLSVHRIKVRYKQSLLGIFWAILQPLSMMLIFTFIFSIIARMPSEGAPSYAIFAYTALLPWNYFSSGVSNATNSLVSHSQFVTKVYFPREILPITYVMAALFDFAVAATLLVGLMIYYHVQPTVNALYAVPIIFILSCFALAMSFFFSATQVRIRDIGVAVRCCCSYGCSQLRLFIR